MAPKRPLEDQPPAALTFKEESDDGTVDEEENGPVEGEDDKENSGDDDEEEEEEEEEDDDEEEEEEDNEEEKEKSFSMKTLVTSSSAVSKPQSHSASEDESESGSDTESDNNNNNQSPSASDFTIKPIVSKPMNDSVKPEKKNAPAKPSSSKRPAESELNPKDPKKKKVMNSGDDEDARKGRLWSEDDEIAILKGMIDYQAKKGSDPYANMGAFHEYMKKNLRVDVSKNQLMDKIRRLRKKYLTNAEKGENGEDPVFSKAHESKSFELSKKIWGVEANGMDDNAKSSKRKPNQSNKVSNATVLALPVSGVAAKKEELNVTNGGVKADPDEFWSKYPCLSGSLRLENCSPRSEDLVRLMIQRMPLIGSLKAKELDDRWRKLQLVEMELSVKKLDLMHEQSRLVLDAMKSPKD